MNVSIAVSLLRLLKSDPKLAMSAVDLAAKWYRRRPYDESGLLNFTAAEILKIRRYTKGLATADEDGPALLEEVQGDPPRYYINASRVNHWFMTEEVALNILLTEQVLNQPFGAVPEIGVRNLTELAKTRVAASAEMQRLRDRLRIVPDGIGRRPADIDPDVLKAAVEAVAGEKQLSFKHKYRGEPPETTHLVSPQGLVAKDGTIYLLATTGFGDLPQRFSLDRISNAEVSNKSLVQNAVFDLDQYIEDSHQLSHKLDENAPPIRLRLLVAPETIYHFKERPLDNQKFGGEKSASGWFFVEADVHYTILLVPFLLSMGGWIEVLDPPEVRKEMALRAPDAYWRAMKSRCSRPPSATASCSRGWTCCASPAR